MQNTATKDTAPELAVRRALHRRGLRYRVNYAVPGAGRFRADIAFVSERVVVLVDGCFWHGCSVHSRPPETNAEWWVSKVQENRDRDARANEIYERLTWFVVRVWEHEDPELVADRVELVLAAGS